MSRLVLASSAVSSEVLKSMERFHSDVVKTVSETVAKEKVVVVGMAQNPFVKKARNALQEHGIDFKYLEYGSYLGQWKQRLAIKLWSGWPTFPQVFVNGILIGGATDTIKAIANGSIKKSL